MYTGHGNVRCYQERFSDEDVEDSFMYLLEKLECFWSEVDICWLTRVCSQDVRISEELSARLTNITVLRELFDLLSKTPFFTWLDITILKRIARVAQVPKATQMIKIFEECVHSKRCSEVECYLKKQYINPSHLACVVAKYNKHSENLIVADLISYCRKLETISGLQPESGVLIKYERGCLEICYFIPMHYCSSAYENARNNYFKFRLIQLQYLQIKDFSKIHAVNMSEKEKESTECLVESGSSISYCKLHTYII